MGRVSVASPRPSPATAAAAGEPVPTARTQAIHVPTTSRVNSVSGWSWLA